MLNLELSFLAGFLAILSKDLDLQYCYLYALCMQIILYSSGILIRDYILSLKKQKKKKSFMRKSKKQQKQRTKKCKNYKGGKPKNILQHNHRFPASLKNAANITQCKQDEHVENVGDKLTKIAVKIYSKCFPKPRNFTKKDQATQTFGQENIESVAHEKDVVKGVAHEKNLVEGVGHKEDVVESVGHEKDVVEGVAHEKDLVEGVAHEKDVAEGVAHEKDVVEGIGHEKNVVEGVAHEKDLVEGVTHEKDLVESLKYWEPNQSIEKLGNVNYLDLMPFGELSDEEFLKINEDGLFIWVKLMPFNRLTDAEFKSTNDKQVNTNNMKWKMMPFARLPDADFMNINKEIPAKSVNREDVMMQWLNAMPFNGLTDGEIQSENHGYKSINKLMKRPQSLQTTRTQLKTFTVGGNTRTPITQMPPLNSSRGQFSFGSPLQFAKASALITPKTRVIVGNSSKYFMKKHDNYQSVDEEHQKEVDRIINMPELAGKMLPEMLPPKLTQDLDFLKYLGGGAFGRVFLCRSKQSDEEVTVKVIKKTDDEWNNEVAFMKQFNHPNVVDFRWNLEFGQYSFICMQNHGRNMSFTNYLDKYNYGFNLGIISFFSKQILDGLDYIHGCGISHLDLKEENIIINELLEMRIIDFGISINSRKKTVDDPYYIYAGTIPYMSPEMTLGDGNGKTNFKKIYGPECDVWSFGVILYRLFTFQDPFPFTEEGAIFNRRESFIRNLAVLAKTGAPVDLISMLLEQDSKKRLTTTSEVLQHSFFNSISFTPNLSPSSRFLEPFQ